MTELSYEEISSSVDRGNLPPDVFERAIIGCLLECQSTQAAKIASECEEQIFASPCNEFVYSILRNAAFARTPLGRETAAGAIQQAPGSLEHFNNLDDVTDYLMDCIEVCQPHDSWPEYVKQLHLAYTRRKLLAAFDDASISALKADSAEDAAAEAIYKVIETAGELRRSSIIKDEVKIDRIADRYLERYEKQDAILFRYPQEKLNFAGGARKGQVIIICAPTGGKKSWWVLDVLLNAAINHKCKSRLYTLEMDENDIVDRMLAMEGLELDDVIQMKAPLERVKQLLLKIKQLPISVVDKRISHARIIADLAGLPAEERPDIIAADHLDLFPSKDGNEVNALRSALANYKDAAKEYGVTFILVAQFRRPRNDDEQQHPHLGMLKGGSAIEQIADMVVFINSEVERTHFGDDETTYMSVPKIRQGKKPKRFKVQFRNFRLR